MMADEHIEPGDFRTLWWQQFVLRYRDEYQARCENNQWLVTYQAPDCQLKHHPYQLAYLDKLAAYLGGARIQAYPLTQALLTRYLSELQQELPEGFDLSEVYRHPRVMPHSMFNLELQRERFTYPALVERHG